MTTVDDGTVVELVAVTVTVVVIAGTVEMAVKTFVSVELRVTTMRLAMVVVLDGTVVDTVEVVVVVLRLVMVVVVSCVVVVKPTLTIVPHLRPGLSPGARMNNLALRNMVS